MPKGRVESFSDCVIAFAITLLILDIHLQDVGTNTNSAGMIHAIMALAPHFLIYVISFLICTVAWISHHEFIHDLDYVDPMLLWLNSLYLMWIAFLPFPTGLLGNHPEQPVAVAVYGSVCSANFIADPKRLPELGRTTGPGSTDSENHIRAFYPQEYALPIRHNRKISDPSNQLAS